jgi:hypothetical protein
MSINSFYVSTESILKPYSTEKVQIYFRQRIQVVVRPEDIYSEEVHKSTTDTTDVSDHTDETTEQEPKIGFYTKQERSERIKRFKAKKQRALANKNNKKVKYAKKSQVAKSRARVNGKFVKT